MSVMELPPPGKQEKLAEIDRELRMREQVYPKLVASKKLRQRDADRRIETLRAIRGDIERQP